MVAGVMLDSMFHSMTTSLQLAQECLKQEPSEGEQQADSATPFEGLEMFAQTIEAGIPPITSNRNKKSQKNLLQYSFLFSINYRYLV